MLNHSIFIFYLIFIRDNAV